MELCQWDDPLLRDITCLSQLNANVIAFMPRFGKGFLWHHFASVLPTEMRVVGNFPARRRMEWVLDHHPGPLVVLLINSDGKASRFFSVKSIWMLAVVLIIPLLD